MATRRIKNGKQRNGCDMKKIDALMRQAIADTVFPGGVLLVAKADAVVFFEAYGVADTFSGRKMIRNTVFDLTSLTKPLATTLSVIRLVSDGKLELDRQLAYNATFKQPDRLAGMPIDQPGRFDQTP